MNYVEIAQYTIVIVGVIGLGWYAQVNAMAHRTTPKMPVRKVSKISQARHRNGQYAKKAVIWINDSWKAGVR